MFLRGKKLFLGLFLALSASLFAPNISASALQLSDLEPTDNTTDAIELNEPQTPYNFDATFLDNNQSLEYEATILNDSENDVKFSNIELNNSSYDFFEYSYSGINASDVIKSGESKTIKLSVKTTDTATSTVNEDYNLQINYIELSNNDKDDNKDEESSEGKKDSNNPNTSATTLLIIPITAISIAIIFFVFKKTGKIRTGIFVLSLPFFGILMFNNSANAEGDLSFNILGNIHFVNSYNITINPNGGSYNNHDTAYTDSYREGSIIRFGTPERATYNFDGWTAEGGEINNNTLIVTSDATITAQWSEINHTITINPNGGSYNDTTDITTLTVRDGSTFHIGADPSRTSFSFEGWNITPNTLDPNDNITVTEDITFKALWNEKYFNVTIDPNGGEYLGHSSIYTEPYREGETIAMQDATRATYRFTGWTMSVGSLTNSQFDVVTDVTLTANWEEIFYTLTIDPNGGDYTGHTAEFSEDYRMNTIVDLSIPTKTGCEFAYWKLEDDSHYESDTITIDKDYKLVAQYNDSYFNVTVNPNGGKFNGSTEVYTANVKYGTTIDLTNTEYAEHEIQNWTKETAIGEEILAADIAEITITEDTDLTINWWSNIFYTITINPNEGSYHDSTEIQEFRTRKGESFTIDEATREGYILTQWTLEDDSVLAQNPFIVDQDHTLTAHWELAVARIERTGKLYPSIMAAHEEANPGNISNDTITLLVDTTEVVTNEKQVTLDLNQHTVTGYLTNTAAGDITLINGEINNYDSPITNNNNPNGAAVINNGKLTMGVNDFTSDGTVNILRDNIRLIGTEIGILQNNEFYFYDGFIEGVVGLDGGYDGSPFYRNTFDDTIVYYFPLVTHNDTKDCQHVELQNADRAVSKTSEHGDIYYYNLQDNINTSTKTGYTIYAIRNFDASYPISVSENANIDFDLVGYVVSAGDDWTIDGTLNITDSKSTDNTGALRASRTITNNGNLNFSSAKTTALSANTLIDNRGNLSLADSTLSSEYGYALEVNTDETNLTMNDNSYILTNTAKITPVINKSSDFTISGGNIMAVTTAIQNDSNAGLTIESGNISATNTSSHDAVNAIQNVGNLNIHGGNISAVTKDSSSSSATAIRIPGGQKLNITGGNISAYAQNSQAYGVNISSCNSTVSGGIITATAQSTATAYSSNSKVDISGGEFIATSKGSTTTAANFSATANITGGSFTSTATGTNKADGFYIGSQKTTINGDVEINATSASGVAEGVYIRNGSLVVIDGNIHGGTYGITTYTGQSVTLGNNDLDNQSTSILEQTPVVDGGQIAIYLADLQFYDGYLKSGASVQSNLKSLVIPHDAKQIIEVVDNEECSWLIHNDNYLSVDGIEYNSLSDAYEAAKLSTNEPKTIVVIADYEAANELPEFIAGQDITLDLNGHSLKYMQTLINYGTLTITDSSSTGDGVFENIDAANTATIKNYGTLIQNGGTISSGASVIESYSGNSTAHDTTQVILNSGKLHAYTRNSTSIKAMGCNGNHTITLNEGHTTLIEGTKAMSIYGFYGCVVNINGGNVTVNNSTSSLAQAFTHGQVTLNSGSINITGNYTNSSGGYQAAIYRSAFTMNGGSINVDTKNQPAIAIDITATSATINAGTITSHSTINSATGISSNSQRYRGTLYMNGGSISAISDSSTGTGADLGRATILGGSISGSTYGINGNSNGNIITLGEDDETISNGPDASPSISGGQYGIYNGYVSFYDGVLKAETPYNSETIKAIPDGAIFHNETIDGVPNCWLEYGENYLRVNGQEFNSLSAAYNAAANGDTIEVIADYLTQADLPTNPQDKAITIDLAGHHLSYYQTVTNQGSLTIADSVGGGILENINPTVTPTITNDRYATLTITGGTITSTRQTITNNGTIYLEDGTVSAIDEVSYYDTKAISSSGTITISSTGDTQPSIIASSSNGSAYAIYGGATTINNGTITSTANTASYATYNTQITVNNGSLSSTSTSGSAYAISNNSGNPTINGGNITATGAQASAAVDLASGSSVKITGGHISASSPTRTAYGVRTPNSTGSVEISDGIIEARSDSSVAYGVYASSGTITGGKLYGSTYGLSTTRSNAFTIGNDDGTISTTSPEIIGDSYAVYDGQISFYDGVLKGQLGTDSGANFDRNIKSIATDSAIQTTTETIDGTEYEVKYLVPAHDVARIGSTNYTSLYKAIEAAQANDVIYLLEDNYIYDKIVVDDTKDITIDLDGYNIITGNQIINNGMLKITNSSQSSRPLIDYHETNVFLNNYRANNSDITPTLTLDNLDIRAGLVVQNYDYGKLIISNSNLHGTSDTSYVPNVVKSQNGDVEIINSNIYSYRTEAITASYTTLNIKDSSVVMMNKDSTSPLLNLAGVDLTIDNSTIDSENYKAIDFTIQSSTGNVINNSVIKGKIRNYGTLSITDSALVQNSSYEQSYITNESTGTLNLTNLTINRISSGISKWAGTDSTLTVGNRSLLQNKGVLNINNVNMTHGYSDNNTCNYNLIGNSGTATINNFNLANDDSGITSTNTARTVYGILNTGTMTLNNSSIALTRSTSYGIYNRAGTLNMDHTTINISGETAYGIYVEDGDLTMGEAEPTDSPNYGTENAAVSTTDPKVTAIGTTTGIGVYKDVGRFKYYDGIITGSTWAIPRDNISSDVEHLYEPTFHTDENGHDVCILTWMREQASQPGD